MSNPDSPQRPIRTVIVVAVVTLTYAIVRYNLFGDVPIQQIPLYVVNKAAAVASLIFLGLSLLTKDRENRKRFGRGGFVLLGGHVIISTVIVTPAYFAKYYDEDGTFHANIEAGLAFGAVGAMCAAYLFMSAPKENNGASLRRGAGRLVLAVTALHTALLGYPTWADVQSWPGYLPPLTMISTGIAIVMLAMRSARGRA